VTTEKRRMEIAIKYTNNLVQNKEEIYKRSLDYLLTLEHRDIDGRKDLLLTNLSVPYRR
jgi:hypothetical protein